MRVKKILGIAGKGALALITGAGALALGTVAGFVIAAFVRNENMALPLCLSCLFFAIAATVLYFFFLARRRGRGQKMPYLATAAYVGFMVGVLFVLIYILTQAASKFADPVNPYWSP